VLAASSGSRDQLRAAPVSQRRCQHRPCRDQNGCFTIMENIIGGVYAAIIAISRTDGRIAGCP